SRYPGLRMYGQCNGPSTPITSGAAKQFGLKCAPPLRPDAGLHVSSGISWLTDEVPSQDAGFWLCAICPFGIVNRPVVEFPLGKLAFRFPLVLDWIGAPA